MSINSNEWLLTNLNIMDGDISISSTLQDALLVAQEAAEINRLLSEGIESISKLTPNCDAIDYSLAVSSGVICGIVDVFLVGKPGESPIGKVTDAWFEERIIDFAKLCKCENVDGNVKNAIRFLEAKFK